MAIIRFHNGADGRRCESRSGQWLESSTTLGGSISDEPARRLLAHDLRPRSAGGFGERALLKISGFGITASCDQRVASSPLTVT
jgi:hypothetical protein